MRRRALLYSGLSGNPMYGDQPRVPGSAHLVLGKRYLTIENFPIDKRRLWVFTVRIENRHIH
jgi:hypothetical protein